MDAVHLAPRPPAATSSSRSRAATTATHDSVQVSVLPEADEVEPA